MALILHYDATDPASWANLGTNPENWNDISGYGGWGGPGPTFSVINAPSFITDGAVNGLRMQNSLQQCAEQFIGSGDTSGSGISPQIFGGSFTVAMWIKFNAAPTEGSGSGGTDMPTTIFSALSSTSPYLIFSSNRGDSLVPRSINELAFGYVDSVPAGWRAGTWSPSVAQWYQATLVFERTTASSGSASLYVNGSLQGTIPITGTVSPIWQVASGGFSGNWTLNASYYTPASPSYRSFGGDITYSVFKLYNTALSSVDVEQTFIDESPAFGFPTMSTIAVSPPYPTFSDRNGNPLDNGYIFVGDPNVDPQSNPVACFFDEALTIPAVQPIRTINGYASNAGTPARIFIDATNYSIRVLDSKGAMIVNSEVQPMPALFTTLSASTSVSSPLGTFNSLTATTGAITTLTGTTATFSDVNGTTVDATTATATTGNITTVNATTVNTATLNVTGNTQLGNSTAADTISIDARIGLNRAAAADYLIYGKSQTSASGDYAWRFQNSSSTSLGWLESDGTFNTGLAALSPRNYTTTSTSDYCVVDANGTLRRSTSSARYKANIRDNPHGLEDVLRMRAVLYEGKSDSEKTHGGLIAEELDAIGLTEFVAYDSEGRPDNVSYSGLTSLLAKAIQQQQAVIEQQRAELAAANSLIEALSATAESHQAALESILSRVAALEPSV